ncbi:hypothetical protein [Streptomyces scabiei]|uniref:hypothetical protein n=1 Tax=Streptomyces scabiei TaxID=1930 RepID=UPI0037BBBC4D
MKRFGMDLDELAEKAAGAARLEGWDAQFEALTVVFQECGERANAYFDKRFAARQLVRECVREFQAERADMKGELINA